MTAERAFPGLADQISAARRWVVEQAAIPPSHPRAYDVALVASELATNAVMHSASGAPAGQFTLQVSSAAGAVELTCTDQGPALLSAPHGHGEGGRGLALVAELVDAYDVIEKDTARIVWCRLEWPTTANGWPR